MAKKPFCTIEIETVEMAAYLMAITNPSASQYCDGDVDSIAEAVYTCIQGGKDGMNRIRLQADPGNIWHQLEAPLKKVGAHYDQHDAPWLKPKAPTEIDGNPVTYSKAGIAVGCANVSLDELKLIVEECEACDE